MIKYFESKEKIFSVVCLLVCLSFSSCSQKEKEKPANLLDKEKMEAVLSDCFLVESYISAEYIGLTDSVKRVGVQQLYADIFEKHDITKHEYDESYSYYSREARNMDEMLKEVVSALENKKRETKTDTVGSVDSTVTIKE